MVNIMEKPYCINCNSEDIIIDTTKNFYICRICKQLGKIKITSSCKCGYSKMNFVPAKVKCSKCNTYILKVKL
jgi:hypothetical protein